MYKLGFIGAGNMASAIANGIVKSGSLSRQEIVMCDIDSAKLDTHKALGYAVTTAIDDVSKSSERIVLSVKPQMIDSVLDALAGVTPDSVVFISIAAGVTSEHIKKKLGSNCKLILVMPNTPIMVGAGSTAIAKGNNVTNEEFETVRGWFASSGYTMAIPESLLNEVIPLNGSSPAFLYRFAELFVAEGVKRGFEEKTANEFFCHAMIGAAKMMLESGKTHEELIKMVTSPKGTTLEGLKALEEHNLDKAVAACTDRTIKRAYELCK